MNIEWLSDRYGRDADNKKIYDCWRGDYIDGRLRAVPFHRVIGLIDPKYALELLSKIYEPKQEALAARYELVHRRLDTGRFSALGYSSTDPEHFSKFLEISREASTCIKHLLIGKCSRSYLKSKRKKLQEAKTPPSNVHRFDGHLMTLLDLILSDSPELGYTITPPGRLGLSEQFSFLELLYEAAFEVYVSFQKEKLNFQEKSSRNPNGFFNAIRHSNEEHRLRQELLSFRASMWKHFSDIIEQDLKAVIKPEG